MGKGCYSYKVEPRDVDFRMKASLVSICDYILQAAGDDADKNNFGVRNLNCDGCSWVLLRMGVEISRRLGEYEEFTVRTWVSDVNRMMTTRNMVLLDASGEVVAAAVTQWAIIDIEKRRAVDITRHTNYKGAVIDEPSPIAVPARIPALEPDVIKPHTVVYSDIDFNRHVGTVKYVGWMYDMLPEDIIMHKEIARLDINFLHEARYGQHLQIGFTNGERSVFEVSSEDGKPLCRAVMSWKEDAV